LLFFVKSVRIHLWSMDEKGAVYCQKMPVIVQYSF
jgi:hypothetical protein